VHGFLTGLNEQDEDGIDEGEGEESEPNRQPFYQQEHMDQPYRSVASGRAGQRDGVVILAGAKTFAATKIRSASRRAHKGFELDMGNATLLGRRHNKPLAGSPLKVDSLRIEDAPMTQAKVLA